LSQAFRQGPVAGVAPIAEPSDIVFHISVIPCNRSGNKVMEVLRVTGVWERGTGLRKEYRENVSETWVRHGEDCGER
jgi:hypothetical protein